MPLYGEAGNACIAFTPANPSSAAGLSMAAVVYRNAQSVQQQVLSIKAATNGDQAQIMLGSDNTLRTTSSVSTVAVPFQKWILVACTKPTGSSTYRLHLYDYSAFTWTHQNSSTGNTASWAGTGTMTGKLFNGDGVDGFSGFIDCAGIFQKDLSDTEIEQLAYSWGNWLMQSSALHLWRLDRHPSTANPVSPPIADWAGNGGQSTSYTNSIDFFKVAGPLSIGSPLITTSHGVAAPAVRPHPISRMGRVLSS